MVPSRAPVSSSSSSFPPAIRYRIPRTWSFVLVIISTWETAAMLESASPRNPRDPICTRSSTERILLVECRKNALGTSDASMPQPLSAMRIIEMPPSSISVTMAVAPASMAFSTSSFTTDAGRSITSPAAILSIVTGSNTCILFMSYHLFFSLFCNWYNVFSASIGVRLLTSRLLISSITSSSFTVSNRDIWARSTSS